AEYEGRHQEQGRQGRGDEGARQPSGDAEAVGFHLVHGRTTMSPAARPLSTSTMSCPSCRTSSPRTTARSTSVPASVTRTKSSPARVATASRGIRSASRSPTGSDTSTRRSEEHTSEPQSREKLVCRPLLEDK